ncbi:SGNH/GDSL hydrolase family protein [Mycetocola tolaasinivorans]|uniref:SGNH/GDSL hydrolase family protein n=1 Tax=Mycetocola tolaasinivorans TaxID=76635 RepID=A0A3L7ACB2_9MICO|nr:SGNH/GDSL hydrolase family protein [Mycetocola tolaasinivorans]RLP77857.1 SGNH/GDSL hydrolase family protein [Mycetocola tolaasinivorans]
MFSSYVAVGDSFSEGMGDTLPDGSVRGWTDLVALALGRAAGSPIRYANLAIRGKKLEPIIAEQVDPALALGAELVTFNGAGNDIMRPRVSIEAVAGRLVESVQRLGSGGARVIVVSGANPSRHIPMGGLVSSRGDELAEAVTRLLPASITYVDNWSDPVLAQGRFWSHDNLHLNTIGHVRVAANVLNALGIAVPAEWAVEDTALRPDAGARRRDRAYYREHVLPWIGRRLTGRSSGDGRPPKFATLDPVTIPDPTITP